MKLPQAGFGLIELMVALVLGLIASGVAMQLLLVNNQTFALQRVSSSLEDDGQMLLRYMMADIRQAGRGTAVDGTIEPVVFDNTQVAYAQEGSSGSNDELVINYFGVRDCQGGGDGSEQEIVNRYFVDNQGVLSCSGSLSGGVAELMSGVESFQVQYGIDTNVNGEPSVTRYVNAGGQGSNPVVSIRFAVLLSSDSNIQVDAAASTFYLADQVINVAADARLRKVFRSTVMIRNYDWDGV
ncbi:PilW family protein [Halopseudomonas sp.]|uniref:PilW family protein n=1 Tax=Halopseudomonas sp. TaxID=2901191 RepID=UPI00311E3400